MTQVRLKDLAIISIEHDLCQSLDTENIYYKSVCRSESKRSRLYIKQVCVFNWDICVLHTNFNYWKISKWSCPQTVVFQSSTLCVRSTLK